VLNVVTWLWGNGSGKFNAGHVNTLASMVRRHYAAPYRFRCVTNTPAGIAQGIEIVPDTADFAGVKSPHGGRNPACFRRLRMFSAAAAGALGDRFVSLDLDAVITGDLLPLWNRPEPFVGWRDPMHARQINGSMMLHTAGTAPAVWDTFDPAESPKIARDAGFMGSDQGWVSYCLAGRCATWGARDGVYSYRCDVAPHRRLPHNARIVFFHGNPKPWDEECMRALWIRENYR
jgi:hypothetical protein